MSDYVPIACVEHERLEFAVLRRQRLRLEYRDETGLTASRVVLPTDVRTRDGAEWLSYRCEDGVEAVIRLDLIVSARPAV
jgi:Rho-binding antiterminator